MPGVLAAALELLAVFWLLALAAGLVRLWLITESIKRDLTRRGISCPAERPPP